MKDGGTIYNFESNSTKICKVCYKRDCNCGWENKIEVDSGIADALTLLNQKGYKTFYSCAGHVRADFIKKGILPRIYIMFNKWDCKDFDITPLGEGWEYQKTDNVLSYQFKDIKFIYNNIIKQRKNLLEWARKLC